VREDEGGMPTIIRVKHSKEHPYLVVSRKLIEDEKLDYQAQGFLISLLAKPDDWQFVPKLLGREKGVGVDTVRRIIRRCIKAGYIYRSDERYQDEKTGCWSRMTHYVVFEDKDARQEFLNEGRILAQKTA
jgi:hypothetical protein